MIYCLPILMTTIIISKIIFKINLKNFKKLGDSKELEEITNKFGDNIQVANEILDMLYKEGRAKPKVEQTNSTKASLYIALTHKILIADIKNSYSRIQTIAHECIHSCQDRRLLISNFIISNINIICFFVAILLMVFKVLEPNFLILYIFSITIFIEIIIKLFLEMDAMIKAKYLAKEYIEIKNTITEKEQNKLIEGYDKINKIGIPFVVDNLLTTNILKIMLYIIITIILRG